MKSKMMKVTLMMDGRDVLEIDTLATKLGLTRSGMIRKTMSDRIHLPRTEYIFVEFLKETEIVSMPVKKLIDASFYVKYLDYSNKPEWVDVWGRNIKTLTIDEFRFRIQAERFQLKMSHKNERYK